MRPIRLMIATLVLLPWAAQSADESSLRLSAGHDQTLVLARCSICHSVDYIQMNAPFLKRPQWEAEVKKMIKAYGAPVAEDEVAKITDYLMEHYGAPTGAP
jgi:cytochrome c553